MSNLDFQDRVAIVTGAGGGLGRSHALLLASRGAKVVVNDLGGSFKGEGASQSAADRVVAEIREAGGTAVPSYHSVEDGAAIVETAVSEFGRVDILINNAGVLRDVSFHKMTQDDWDLVYRVHVLGSFRVTHAAWPHMREQGYGRIVMTASAAGIYGNFGQANYSMAKLGLAGLANTLAIEGMRKNIHVNTIAPIAGSRMTETVLPPNLIEALKPGYVSPLVAWLCHDDCDETGGLFEVGGGFFSKLRWERSEGALVRLGREVTPELVRDRWKEIASFERTTHPEHIAASMQPIMQNVDAGPSKGGNQYIDVDRALGYELSPIETSYDQKDLALYALAVGAARDPLDTHDLAYVYEMHSGGMRALPTFAVIPALGAMMEHFKSGEQAPGLNYGFERILHGEQYTEVLRPLPAAAHLTHRARIKDIFDKGKHALVVTEIRSYDDSGEELIRNELTSVVRGAGGWGGDRGPSEPVNVPPERDPDQVVTETIPANQALLYRLTGDINPLHADPSFARTFGFERPILHGLCTFGFAGRQVIRHFAKDGDPRYFKSIRVRFADSVFPGETLETSMWKVPSDSGTKVVFQTRVVERDSVVVSNAAVELYHEIPKPKPKPEPEAKSATAADVPEDYQPTSWDVFVAIRDHIERNPDIVGKIGFVFQFVLSDPGSVWTVDLKNEPGGVSEGETTAPDCTLSIAEADFMAMTAGQADPMTLFTSGKLKISGNIMASQKLEFLQKIDPEEAKAAVIRAREAGEAPGAGTATTAAGSGQREAQAPAILAALEKRLENSPDLRRELDAVIVLRTTDPDGAWRVDGKSGSPAVQPASGGDDTVDATLTLSDANLRALVVGESTTRELFQRGELRVDGDVRVAQRLGILKDLI